MQWIVDFDPARTDAILANAARDPEWTRRELDRLYEAICDTINGLNDSLDAYETDEDDEYHLRNMERGAMAGSEIYLRFAHIWFAERRMRFAPDSGADGGGDGKADGAGGGYGR